jgi:hypothetical protein
MKFSDIEQMYELNAVFFVLENISPRRYFMKKALNGECFFLMGEVPVGSRDRYYA